MKMANSIVEGTYNITTDLDDATNFLFILEEIGKMVTKRRIEEGEEIDITPGDFIKFQKQVGEFTTSSLSGLHYFHYKVSSKCKLSITIHVQQLTILVRNGVNRWIILPPFLQPNKRKIML